MVGFIRSGCFVSRACTLAGVSRGAYYDWKKKGLEARERDRTNIYSEFLEAIEMADADVEVALVSQISRDKSWRAKLEILKRRFPERWGDCRQARIPDQIAYASPMIRNVYVSDPENP